MEKKAPVTMLIWQVEPTLSASGCEFNRSQQPRLTVDHSLFALRSGHPELSHRRYNQPEAELEVQQGDVKSTDIGFEGSGIKIWPLN